MPDRPAARVLLQSLRRLRRTPVPPPGAAVTRAASAVEHHAAPRPHWRLLPTAAGLAAALAVAAVLWAIWPTGRASQASAAELFAELRAAAEKTRRFKGWFTMLDKDGVPKMWWNTVDGSNVIRGYANAAPLPYVEFFDYARGERRLWVESENTIYVQGSGPPPTGQQDAFWNLVNIDALIAAKKADYAKMRKDVAEDGGGEWKTSITRESVGNLVRYTVVDPNYTNIYDADPETGLLKHSISTDTKPRPTSRPSGRQEWFFRYNDPVVNSLHDVGVPADAKVVDHRPTLQVKEILSLNKGWLDDRAGDGAAVLTVMPTHASALMSDEWSNRPRLYLMVRREGQWATWEWLVDVPVKGAGETIPGATDGETFIRPDADHRFGPATIPPPPGWPEPDVGGVMKFVRGRVPRQMFVARDGAEQAEEVVNWTGGEFVVDPGLYDVPVTPPKNPLERPVFTADEQIRNLTLWGDLSGYDVPANYLTVLTASAPTAPTGERPVGLEQRGPADFSWTTTTRPTTRPHAETALQRFWFDAGRGGMPLKTADQITPEGETRRTIFDKPVRWGEKFYPTRWTSIQNGPMTFSNTPQVWPGYEVGYRLSIDGSMQVGDEWFTPPLAKPWPPLYKWQLTTRPATTQAGGGGE